MKKIYLIISAIIFSLNNTKSLAQCSVTISATPDTVLSCTNSIITLKADTTGTNATLYTYLWSTGSTKDTTKTSIAGTYSVTITNGTCTSSDTIVIYSNTTLPAAGIAGIDTLTCITPSAKIRRRARSPRARCVCLRELIERPARRRCGPTCRAKA